MDIKTVLHFLEESSFARDDSFVNELKQELESSMEKLSLKISSELQGIQSQSLEDYERKVVHLRYLLSKLKALEEI